MRKYPIGDEPLIVSCIDSLRIKVTEKCPWACSFCHMEGGIYASDVAWSPELKDVINLIEQHISLKEIHYTGGEPTKNPHLAELSAGLCSLGLEVKTTTNGQFDEEELKRLVNAGLRSYNFSVHSLDPKRFLDTQGGKGLTWVEKGKTSSDIKVKRSNLSIEWAEKQIDKQKKMILSAKEMGLDVKINTVISSENDIENAKEVFEWSKAHNIPVRLLNDLGNGLTSIDAIRKFIDSLGAEEVMRKVTLGSSACSTIYRTKDRYEFGFKQIRDNKLESMCRGCSRIADGTCEEQFYGIRLQKNKDGQYYVVLCIQEDNAKTRMTVAEFLKSDQLKEITSYLYN